MLEVSNDVAGREGQTDFGFRHDGLQKKGSGEKRAFVSMEMILRGKDAFGG